MPKRMIWVTFNREGIHQFHDAPDGVEHLKHPHRHIFHFKVYIEVKHDDREIEFILFKRELEGLYREEVLQLEHRSCEMIADELHAHLSKKYPDREIWIDVSEDNENGVLVRYE